MKLAFGVEYDGTKYYGWQKQKNLPSIQEEIEKAIFSITNEKIDIFCAGRTDAGVHAIGQVIHFTTNTNLPDRAWIMGMNTNLPNDISIKWIKRVPDSFHARYSAYARRYQYIIYNNKIRSSLYCNKVNHIYYLLNEYSMKKAASYLIGKHNFISIKQSDCQSKSSWRKIYNLSINRYGHYLIIDIKANSFLYHMVRNIVGILLDIGSGKKSISWIKNIISVNKKNNFIKTASANGLYLILVYYPRKFLIPRYFNVKYFF
ncbi:MAG: tRNA pseudouridine(38-40) synthase TruA [Candidatus Lightella neohaematopini]|nr:tRNA pseudouridine(38-40) synthase TruA [Candidatus Lightella neohaematopini]MCV2528661.1 tRNA pseudouridine(38-40) synthase TruA [Candidatus Lightella neohaematopini]